MSLAATADVLAQPLGEAAATTCRHCGDPCGTDGTLTGRGVFCCAGCDAVYTLIQSQGLGAFYSCDVAPGQSQRRAARDRTRFAALDDEEIVRRLVDAIGADLVRVTFAVPAMHCASCLWLLEQLWRFDVGVVRSEADLLRRIVRIEFRPSITTLRTVAEQLAARRLRAGRRRRAEI